MELFTDFFEVGHGWEFLSRAGHVLSGITWIGLLYFFNFVQTPAFAAMDAGVRTETMQKISWRALWWFRWAAMATFLFGLSIIAVETSAEGNYFEGPSGTSILTGMLFGLTMLVNVWGIIWPAQKIVIGSAQRVAEGGEADPRAADAGKRSARASRTNTFFSFTMLFFMVFTSHLALVIFDATDFGPTIGYWIFVVVLWGIVEASALGFIGGLDNALNKLLFDDHRRTIVYGLVYMVIVYVIGWELLLGT
jgi:uncharacterized membrane protein